MGFEPTTYGGFAIRNTPDASSDVTPKCHKTSDAVPHMQNTPLGALLGASGPETAPLPPDLAAVVAAWPRLPDTLKVAIVTTVVVRAWPTLPDVIRTGIVAMVKAAGGAKAGE